MGFMGSPMGSAGGAGGSAPFSPTDLAGLKLWLKADAIVGKVDGDPVNAADWPDYSGSGNAPASANAATYKPAALNGMPVVRFNGTTNYYRIARNAGLEPNAITIFAVFRATVAGTPPGGFTYIISKPKDAGNSNSCGIQNLGGTRCVIKVATTGTVIGSAFPAADIWDGGGKIAVITADGLTAREYFPFILGTPLTAVGAIAYDVTDYFIGAYDSTQLYMAFDLAEILLYDSSLSDSDRWRVCGYLGSKWKL